MPAMGAVSQTQLKIILARDRGVCRYPRCGRWLITYIDKEDRKELLFWGELAHIHGVSPKGPRHNPALTKAMLNHFSNVMCLCPRHHCMVDRFPLEYPPELMRTWIEVEAYPHARISSSFLNVVRLFGHTS